jgi:D-3-phosphoglycerate dehydrogenase / 2-oxoglutarate reductase
MTRMLPLVHRVIAYDPQVGDLPSGVERMDSLGELLKNSDVVSLHLPLTPETKHLLDAEAIGLMKEGAMLVNVSRGGLVDEAALAAALSSGRLGGAALDVLEQEPPPSDSALLSMPNVLLSPHFAWYSTSAERRSRTITLDGMLAYLEGRTPVEGRLAVNPGVGQART